MLFTVARDSELYFFYVLNSCFIKAGVPLFFMISGALLLNRNESIKYILKNKIIDNFYNNLKNKEKYKEYFEYAKKYLKERIKC